MDLVTYAIIENNKVVNRIVADEEFVKSLGVEFTDHPDAQIGAELVEGKWSMPPAIPKQVEPTASEILAALIKKGVITEQDLRV